MEKIKEFVEEHPYAIAGCIFAVGIILVFSLRSSESAAPAQASAYTIADNSGAVAANTQLSLAQMASASQANNVSAALQSSLAETAAKVTLGTLAAQNDAANNNLQASVAQSQIAAQAQTQQLMTTLAAQVQQAGINATLQTNMATLDAATQQKAIDAATMTGLAQINSATVLQTQALNNQKAAYDAGVELQRNLLAEHLAEVNASVSQAAIAALAATRVAA